MDVVKTASLYRIFMISGIVALFLAYAGIWFRFINDPVERTGSDFIAFYTAGRIAQSQGAASVYNPLFQQQIQEDEVGFPLRQGQVLLYNHLPFLLPILQMVVSIDYVDSFYRWIFLLIALYITGIAILSQVLKRAGISQRSTLLAATGAFLFLPLFFSLMNGQDTAFLFIGAALWMYALISGKKYLAGLGLSLTTVRPHIALFLAIPTLFRYPKVFLGFLVGSLSLAAVSVLLLGFDGTSDFIEILLLSAGGEWYGMKENAMYNLIGLLTRATPSLGTETIRALGWIIYGIGIFVFSVLWYKARGLGTGIIGTTVTLALFAVPHLHFHDLTLLLIPLYEIILASKATGVLKTSFAIAIPIAISLLFLLSNVTPYLQYTIPYLIMLALALYPYAPKFSTHLTTQHRS